MDVLFRVLGAVAGLSADGELAVPRGAPEGVLARLLLSAGEWVSGDALIALRWPRADAKAGRHRLHVAVSTARGPLGPRGELVENRRGAYRVAIAPLELDLYAFRSAVSTAAAQLDRGEPEEAAATIDEVRPLLRGEPFAGVDGKPFEAERTAHRRAVAEANAIELDALLATGHAEAAVATALAAVAGNDGPAAWEALVRADYLRGGAEAASRRLDEARSAVGDSWSLGRLEQAIRSGDRQFITSPRRTRPRPRPAAELANRTDGPTETLELVRRADSAIRRLDLAGDALSALDDAFADVTRAVDEAWRSSDYAAFCALTDALREYLALRGACGDGARWLGAALTRPELAPTSRAACLETLALLLVEAGRLDAAARYRPGDENDSGDADPEDVDAARERAAHLVTSLDPRGRLAARLGLGQALRSAGRAGEAVGEIAGVVGELSAVDDRLILADALEALSAVDPDPARAGRTAGAVAALSFRMDRRPPVVERRETDDWRRSWRDGWDAVLALPLRGPSPSTRDVVAVVWGDDQR